MYNYVAILNVYSCEPSEPAMRMQNTLRRYRFALSGAIIAVIVERTEFMLFSGQLLRTSLYLCRLDHPGNWEATILENIAQEQLMDLADTNCIPPTEPCKHIKPRQARPAELQFLMGFGFVTPKCYIALEAMHAPSKYCSKGDVVTVLINDSLFVAYVNFHVTVDDNLLSCLTLWPEVGKCLFRVVHDQLTFVNTSSIRCAHTFAVRNGVATVVLF
jgi:hypothetical protein